MQAGGSFVTLTYDDEHFSPSLEYADFQRFMYRVRQKFGRTRFFCAGEYGESTGRPHFHALLFGLHFRDGKAVGADLYRSPTLEALWPFGFSSFGEITQQSAAYCAKYATKKITGAAADQHYLRCDSRTGELVHCAPEFGHMSLKPGIGYSWFQKYWRDVYKVRDGVVYPGGLTVPPPKYYDKLLLDMDHELREWKDFERYTKSKEFASDCTPERLAVREHVAKARINFHKRSPL